LRSLWTCGDTQNHRVRVLDASALSLFTSCSVAVVCATDGACGGSTRGRRIPGRTGQLGAAVRARAKPIKHLWVLMDERCTCAAAMRERPHCVWRRASPCGGACPHARDSWTPP
jgi:hypothetical protein